MKVQGEVKQVTADLSKAKGPPPPYPIQEERFGPNPAPSNKFYAQLDPKVSIQKIIDAIEALECPVCSGGFALEVAKKELKKWEDSFR